MRRGSARGGMPPASGIPRERPDRGREVMRAIIAVAAFIAASIIVAAVCVAIVLTRGDGPFEGWVSCDFELAALADEGRRYASPTQEGCALIGLRLLRLERARENSDQCERAYSDWLDAHDRHVHLYITPTEVAQWASAPGFLPFGRFMVAMRPHDLRLLTACPQDDMRWADSAFYRLDRVGMVP